MKKKRVLIRCLGCGMFSNNKNGEYTADRKTNAAGYINNHGRDCPHDFCEACEAKQAPDYACPICGVKPQ